MKFFLLIVMTLIVFGALSTTSYNCFVQSKKMATTAGRTFYRVLGHALGVAAGVFIFWTIESNTAQEPVPDAPNPINALDAKAAEERNTDVPQLESKTYRERVRQATEK